MLVQGIAHRTLLSISVLHTELLRKRSVALPRFAGDSPLAIAAQKKLARREIQKAQPQKCRGACRPRRGIVISIGREQAERQEKTRITIRLHNDLLDYFQKERRNPPSPNTRLVIRP